MPASLLRRTIRSLTMVSLTLLLASAAHAASMTWNNASGGSWTNAANWTPNQVPTGSADAAVLPTLASPYAVTLDQAVATGKVSVASGATLRMSDAATIGPGANLTIDAGGAVRGSGVISLAINNSGTVEADGSVGAELQINGLNMNYGTIEVSHGGVYHHVTGPLLKNWGSIVAKTGGGTINMMDGYYGDIFNVDDATFVCEGGDLSVSSGIVVNGIVQRTGTGTLDFPLVVLQNLTVAKGAEVSVSGLACLTSSGTALMNHGTVHVSGKMTFGILDAVDNIYLDGDGVMILEGGMLGSDMGNGGPFVNTANHTIIGCGTINAGLVNKGTLDLDCGGPSPARITGTMVNQGRLHLVRGNLGISGIKAVVTNTGTMVAGGTITIDKQGSINNTGGAIVTDGGKVKLGATTSATVTGGRLDGAHGGVFETQTAATLKNVTLGPEAVLVTQKGAVTTASGKWINQGLNRVGNGGTFRVIPGAQYLQTGGVTRLEGGAITSTNDLVIEGGSVTGAGVIRANVVNAGSLIPDLAGALQIDGNYRQLGTGDLRVTLGSTVSRVDVTGAATLDGALGVRLDPGFAAHPGDAFRVLSYGSVDGEFASVGADAAGLVLVPMYGKGGLELMANANATAGVDEKQLPARLAFYGRGGSHGASFVLELPVAAELKARVFDPSGRQVANLADGARAAGVHVFPLASATRGLASGLYFARISVTDASGTQVKTARAVLVQ